LTDNIANQPRAGFRVHKEAQERRQLNEFFVTGGSTLAEWNERDAFALSYFVQDRVEFGRFSVTPGLPLRGHRL